MDQPNELAATITVVDDPAERWSTSDNPWVVWVLDVEMGEGAPVRVAVKLAVESVYQVAVGAALDAELYGGNAVMLAPLQARAIQAVT